MKANVTFTAIFEEEPDGTFIAYVEEMPGVNTQGDTYEEAQVNLLEAFELMMESNRIEAEKSLVNKKVRREVLHCA